MKIELLKEIINQHISDICDYQKQIHMHPELGFREYETSKLIKIVLEKYKINYRTIGTGIVACIYGKNFNKKCIAFRADMDALPIQENTDIFYKSKIPGCMHACGHDFHVANLLGIGIIAQKMSKEFNGTLKLIFQPSEEMSDPNKKEGYSGALQMIENNCLESPNVEEIYGLHVDDNPIGSIGFAKKEMYANIDDFSISITGRGGHAVTPKSCIDPITPASEFINKINTELKKTLGDKGIICIGEIHSGSANNIIPQEAILTGTIRTFEPKYQKKCYLTICRLLKQICKKHKCKYLLKYTHEVPALINTPKLVDSAIQNISSAFSHNEIINLKKQFGGEDFGMYATKTKACFFTVGAKEKNKSLIFHNNKFYLNTEKILPFSLLASLLIIFNQLK
jgi:amidohydrolase